jgi:hypothetical protein
VWELGVGDCPRLPDTELRAVDVDVDVNVVVVVVVVVHDRP